MLNEHKGMLNIGVVWSLREVHITPLQVLQGIYDRHRDMVMTAYIFEQILHALGDFKCSMIQFHIQVALPFFDTHLLVQRPCLPC